MTAEFNGKIALDIRDSEPDWAPYAAPVAPADAPNVLYLVWDDIGIATWDCFGGLVDMPAMSRLAATGSPSSAQRITLIRSVCRVMSPNRVPRTPDRRQGVDPPSSPRGCTRSR